MPLEEGLALLSIHAVEVAAPLPISTVDVKQPGYRKPLCVGYKELDRHRLTGSLEGQLNEGFLLSHYTCE